MKLIIINDCPARSFLFASSLSHLTMVKGVDLLEDPGPTVSRHLLDDLDSVLHVGVDVDTRLDAGVSSFSQHLPRQFVKLL